MNFEFKDIVKRWVLPAGFLDAYSKLFSSSNYSQLDDAVVRLLHTNEKFRGIHRGERCFIVCNGPSVNEQNLLMLKDEIVFSVSSGYHHKEYAHFKPRYHCTPQLTYSDYFTKETAIAWFREMHEKTGDAQLFFGYQEAKLINENGLFPERHVNYVCMDGQFGEDADEGLIDITKVIPQISSVPIMCIIIAIFMGFKKVYLIGVEHDSFIKREYKYFYKHTVLSGHMQGVDDNDKITTPLSDELYIYYRLFMQYRKLREIAEKAGVELYNATKGGALDELERVDYESLWERK